MCLSELKFLEQRLSGFLEKIKIERVKSQLAPLIALVKTTQKLTQSVLIEQRQSAYHKETSFSDKSFKTEERQPLASCENNYQQSNNAAYVFQSPIQLLRKEKSVGQSWTKPKTVIVNFPSRATITKTEKFQLLMENLRQIIRYQNKIEKNCLFREAIPMTDIQQQINPHLFAQSHQQDSSEGQNDPPTSKISNSLNQLFKDCRELKRDLEQIDFKQCKRDTQNHSENTDKKSLLTQMIKASQIVSDMDYFEQADAELAPIQNHRSMSVSAQKLTTRSQKKLLKEIDFSDYKIESIKGAKKKEKKAGLNNCGQCSQCRIF